mmetsp:Transcript_29949/g.67154  ORF Transcript_29949/g.67154 Transcript_29949/m.67154 type:complete len:354 (-) Transcript_29949:481-1542(-)
MALDRFQIWSSCERPPFRIDFLMRPTSASSKAAKTEWPSEASSTPSGGKWASKLQRSKSKVPDQSRKFVKSPVTSLRLSEAMSCISGPPYRTRSSPPSHQVKCTCGRCCPSDLTAPTTKLSFLASKSRRALETRSRSDVDAINMPKSRASRPPRSPGATATPLSTSARTSSKAWRFVASHCLDCFARHAKATDSPTDSRVASPPRGSSTGQLVCACGALGGGGGARTADRTPITRWKFSESTFALRGCAARLRDWMGTAACSTKRFASKRPVAFRRHRKTPRGSLAKGAFPGASSGSHRRAIPCASGSASRSEGAAYSARSLTLTLTASTKVGSSRRMSLWRISPTSSALADP